MALDASDFPSEGQNLNSEKMLPPVDFLLNNIGNVQRTIGARPPVMLPDVNGMPMPEANSMMPDANTLPDAPKSMKLPAPKMMPGANTKPGEVVSAHDIESFNAAVMNNKRTVDNGVRVQVNNMPTYDNSSTVENITYFKDSYGNEYKTVGKKLFVLGWQDSELKVRLVNEKSGKAVNTDGKKFQIYGWHLVNKNENDEDIKNIETEKDISNIVDSLSDNRKQNEEKAKSSEICKTNEKNSPKSTRKSGKRLI